MECNDDLPSCFFLEKFLSQKNSLVERTSETNDFEILFQLICDGDIVDEISSDALEDDFMKTVITYVVKRKLLVVQHDEKWCLVVGTCNYKVLVFHFDNEIVRCDEKKLIEFSDCIRKQYHSNNVDVKIYNRHPLSSNIFNRI
jgi:hypothetical protein